MEARTLNDRVEPFKSTRMEPAILQRPLKLVDWMSPASNDTARVFGSMAGIPDVLPEGTELIFNHFSLSKDYAFLFIPIRIQYEAWFFVPSIDLPEGTILMYVWGRGRYLHRAPWEDESVPEWRYIGSHGMGYNKD